METGRATVKTQRRVSSRWLLLRKTLLLCMCVWLCDTVCGLHFVVKHTQQASSLMKR